MELDVSFYKDKKVFVTGHTGFKGSWLCKMLIDAGAIVTGYSLEAPTNPNLYTIAGISEKMKSVRGDVRNFEHLKDVFKQVQPEIIFHLAAQPIVRESYRNPRVTYETNIMGTVNIMECVRLFPCVRSVLNVTTDKVYRNNEWYWGYREDETLDGFDPYSNSKSCSELVTHSYKRSFFQESEIAVSSARAGNVIGGGDFAKDRIIPDCIRSVEKKKTIFVRNPNSVRPYQHVLEPLYAYLLIAKKQFEDKSYAGSYNVGPDENDCITTGELVDLFCRSWGDEASWASKKEDGPHEADYLKLDCTKIKRILEWKPRWNVQQAVEKTVEWVKVYYQHGNIQACMEKQIQDFLRT